jgi:glutamate carboxypeptidase
VDPLIAEQAGALAAEVRRDLDALVAISSPSGDVTGAEAALEICVAALPVGAAIERPPSSTPGCAPDLLARIAGSGSSRLLLLGHVDTVIAHGAHQPLRAEGPRLYGSGTADMKGGVALALAVARALAPARGRFAELALLLVTDEEWRTAPFGHVERFAGYDACLCFEAGERDPDREDAVIVRRKGAGTLRVGAAGRAAHSGSAPQDGRNALLALSEAAISLASLSDADGSSRLTVVPTVVRCGEAFNVVPAAGELVLDLRSVELDAFDRVRASVPAEIAEVRLEASIERVWPPMDSETATAALLGRAAERLGRPLRPRGRGGASDASHFAAAIPLTVDGLGPRGGGAHTPGEFVLADSLRERLEVALAVAHAALDS